MISNYISPDAITCDDRNLPWTDEKIKSFIKIVTIMRSFEIRNADLFDKFQSPEAHFKSTFDESKQKYYSRLSNKLSDSNTSPKSYWSIWKTFLNNEKISCISPLLHNDKFIMDFKEKDEFFNDFRTKQCSLAH